jgi:N-acetylneuraminic acid mutarotase
MPTPRANFAIASYQGKIYCIGGESLVKPGDYEVYCVVEVYDTVADSWSVEDDVPFEGLGIQAQVIDGQIFVIKGQDLFMYDPVTNLWTQKTSIPRPDDIATDNSVLFDVFSVVVDNKIMIYFKYCPQGSSPIPPTLLNGKVMTYDAKTDGWSEVTKFSEVISGMVWATTGDYAHKKVYISGQSYHGYGLFGVSGTWIYDPVKNTWSTVEDIPTTYRPTTYRDQFGVAVVNDILYIIGGKAAWGYDVFSYNEQYIPIGYTGTGFGPTFSVITAIVLTVCVVVTTLFFYLRGRTRNKRGKI